MLVIVSASVIDVFDGGVLSMVDEEEDRLEFLMGVDASPGFFLLGVSIDGRPADLVACFP